MIAVLVPTGHSLAEIAGRTGTPAWKIATWHRCGWLPQGWPVQTGRRGRPRFHLPIDAIAAARVLERLLETVDSPEDVPVWLWLHGYDWVDITEEDLGRTLEDGVGALYRQLRAEVPILPELRDGRPSEEVVDHLRDRIDATVQAQFGYLGREAVQAGVAVMLCMAGLASREDVEGWDECARTDVENGDLRSVGTMQAMLELMRRKFRGFPREVPALSPDEDLAASRAFFPALSLPLALGQRTDWNAVRAVWRTIADATDQLFDIATPDRGSLEAFVLDIRRTLQKVPVGVVLFFLSATTRAIAAEQALSTGVTSVYLRPPIAAAHHICTRTGRIHWLGVLERYPIGDALVAVTHQCPDCVSHHIEHHCSHTGTTTWLPITRQPPPAWFPVLKATVKAACPTCGLVVDMADTVANDPEASTREREAAAAFSRAALALGAAIVAVQALSWVEGASSN